MSKVSVPATLPARSAKVIDDVLYTASHLVVINNQEDYAFAGERLVAIKNAQKTLELEKVKILKPISDGVAALRALFKGPSDRLDQAESDIKSSMVKYIKSEEAKRLARQKALDDAAAEERMRIQQAADKAAMVSAAKANEVRIEAAKLEKKGQLEKAAALSAKAISIEDKAQVVHEIASAMAVSVVTPTVVFRDPVASGIGTRKVWKFEVTNESLVSDMFKTINTKLIQAAIDAGHRDIAGVRIYQEDIITAARSKY